MPVREMDTNNSRLKIQRTTAAKPPQKLVPTYRNGVWVMVRPRAQAGSRRLDRIGGIDLLGALDAARRMAMHNSRAHHVRLPNGSFFFFYEMTSTR